MEWNLYTISIVLSSVIIADTIILFLGRRTNIAFKDEFFKRRIYWLRQNGSEKILTKGKKVMDEFC